MISAIRLKQSRISDTNIYILFNQTYRTILGILKKIMFLISNKYTFDAYLILAMEL